MRRESKQYSTKNQLNTKGDNGVRNKNLYDILKKTQYTKTCKI